MPFGMISGDGGSSPEELFRSLPPVTKLILTTTVCLLISGLLGVDPGHFVISWDLVWNKFHIWRLYTGAFFPGSPSFSSLLAIYSIIMYSVRYERDGFSTGGGGGSADFAFMLIFGVVLSEAIMLLMFYQPYIFVFRCILFHIMYVWTRKNPRMGVSMWGLNIQAVYIPWVMLTLDLVLSGSIVHGLVGIAVGHLYYFLVDVLPDLHDIDLLKTPEFLVRWLGWGTEGPGVHRSAPQSRGYTMPPPGDVPPPQGFPRSRPTQWGPGRSLGSS